VWGEKIISQGSVNSPALLKRFTIQPSTPFPTFKPNLHSCTLSIYWKCASTATTYFQL